MLGKKKPIAEKILILGLGGVGTYLTKRLVHEGYAVTAIEPDSHFIDYIDGHVDARLIQGSAMSIDCWREANAQNTDVLIAVTNNDAVNMLAAMIADRFGISLKIARVRSLDFGSSNSLLKKPQMMSGILFWRNSLSWKMGLNLVI